MRIFRKNCQIKNGKFDLETFSKSIESGDLSMGGKMTSKFLDKISNDCKDVANDDKYILHIFNSVS